MFRLLFAILALIAAAVVAGACLRANPALLVLVIFALFGIGLYLLHPISTPSLPPGSGTVHWGSGEGIYFDGKDTWVESQERRDERRPNDADKTLH